MNPDQERRPLSGERALWGGLRAGPHTVGFRTWWEYDHARVYDPPYGAETAPARPILTDLWYPARPATGSWPMCYGEYLEIGSDDPSLNEFAQRLVAFNRDMVSQEVFWKPLARLTAEEQALFEQLI